MRTKYRMKFNALIIPVAMLVAVPLALRAAAPDFTKEIKPILEQNCIKCHGEEQKRGGLRLHTKAAAIVGGDTGATLVPGKSKDSPLFTSTILPADDEKVMPPQPKNKRLSVAQTELLKAWIDQGAAWPDDVKLAPVRLVEFVKDIQPILEFNCVACHRDGHKKGGLRLDEKDLAFAGGDTGKGIVPGKPKESLVYVATSVSTNDDRLMPPLNKNGPLPKDEIDLLAAWIEQGAQWPDGLILKGKKKEEAGGDEVAAVTEIHKQIIARSRAIAESEMKAYSNTIPGTQVSFRMTPIKGGEFVMGSAETEKGRKPDEGPQHKVKIAPFWMGTHEVTWNEYELFMYQDEERKFKKEIPTDPYADKISDAVSRPTKPYVEMSFGMGKDDYPAISMTHHAANKYCEWLSAKMGEYYRLPTEAEWEYACRAGTKTQYSFGDDESQINRYAWFEKNSDFKYQKIGRKQPNPWGLYDMHGNVAEWTLDGYEPNAYETFKDGVATDPFVRGTKPYPHVARGGSWDDAAPVLRSAARRFSDKSWKQQDPQLPKSIWYLTDAQFLGFRIVRPLKVPTPEELQKVWNNGVERE
jgi:formylglycine-generating enzyme required for sulfatase activity/mono/diheme cytochrome c family protein